MPKHHKKYVLIQRKRVKGQATHVPMALDTTRLDFVFRDGNLICSTFYEVFWVLSNHMTASMYTTHTAKKKKVNVNKYKVIVIPTFSLLDRYSS